jgi:toxin ParE1/3/4
MSLRYTAPALVQLAEIFDCIAQDNPRAARAVQAQIKSSIEKLTSFPFAVLATERAGVRVLTVTRYPYRIFYRVYGEGDVVILRILHAARDPSRL